MRTPLEKPSEKHAFFYPNSPESRSDLVVMSYLQTSDNWPVVDFIFEIFGLDRMGFVHFKRNAPLMALSLLCSHIWPSSRFFIFFMHFSCLLARDRNPFVNAPVQVCLSTPPPAVSIPTSPPATPTAPQLPSSSPPPFRLSIYFPS